MKHQEKVAPIAAMASALSCIACCLPVCLAAAAGTAGIGVALEPLRPYLLPLSVVLLLVGLWQLYARPKACSVAQRRISVAIFWVSAVVVVTLLIAPQFIAGWLADL